MFFSKFVFLLQCSVGLKKIWREKIVCFRKVIFISVFAAHSGSLNPHRNARLGLTESVWAQPNSFGAEFRRFVKLKKSVFLWLFKSWLVFGLFRLGQMEKSVPVWGKQHPFGRLGLSEKKTQSERAENGNLKNKKNSRKRKNPQWIFQIPWGLIEIFHKGPVEFDGWAFAKTRNAVSEHVWVSKSARTPPFNSNA